MGKDKLPKTGSNILEKISNATSKIVDDIAKIESDQPEQSDLEFATQLNKKGLLSDKTLRNGLYITLSLEERQMVDALKSKYAMNISQMIKNHIRDTFGRLENGKAN